MLTQAHYLSHTIRRSAELRAQAAVALEFRTHLRNQEILTNEELLRERRTPLELEPFQTPLAPHLLAATPATRSPIGMRLSRS